MLRSHSSQKSNPTASSSEPDLGIRELNSVSWHRSLKPTRGGDKKGDKDEVARAFRGASLGQGLAEADDL